MPNEKDPHAPETINIIAVTSDYNWGKGQDLTTALKNANVSLNTKKISVSASPNPIEIRGMGGVSSPAPLYDLGDLQLSTLFDDYDLIQRLYSLEDRYKVPGDLLDRLYRVLEKIETIIVDDTNKK
jgi:hypothetical protein